MFLACRSQDFITPKEQQYETAPEALKAGHHHLRSPAQLSPNRIKRPRNVLGMQAATHTLHVLKMPLLTDACVELDIDKGPGCPAGNTHPTSMEYTQPSQSFERSNMEPPSTSGFCAGEEYGGPRKLVRTRQPSPPCARNVFVDGPEDSGDISKFPRRPPFVSRYRCAQHPYLLQYPAAVLPKLCSMSQYLHLHCASVGFVQGRVQGDDLTGSGQLQQGLQSLQQI